MYKLHFTQEQLVQVAKLLDADIRRINECRGSQNRLGFAYQLCYVKLFNCLPTQSPFIAIEELATFVAVQLDLPREQLEEYALQQWTFSHHQEQIRAYLFVEKFSKAAEDALGDYLFQQAQQIHSKESLFMKATEFLKDKKILNPANDTIERLIQAQREKSKIYILEKIRFFEGSCGVGSSGRSSARQAGGKPATLLFRSIG